MKELEEIFRDAVREGEHRSNKAAYATAISAFIGGLYVTFGGLIALLVVGVFDELVSLRALAWFIGSMFYPIGFMFVVIGRSELFTENFLHPVLAVWEGHAQHRQLVKLWSLGFIFNIIGVFVVTLLIAYSGLLSTHPELDFIITAEFNHVMKKGIYGPISNLFMKAIFAGLFINFMSWLVVASEDFIGKIFVIWLTTFPIMFLGTHHAVVGSSEILVGIFHGSITKVSERLYVWLYAFLLPVSIGNHVGGVVFVAVLHYLQRFFHLELELFEKSL